MNRRQVMVCLFCVCDLLFSDGLLFKDHLFGGLLFFDGLLFKDHLSGDWGTDFGLLGWYLWGLP